MAQHRSARTAEQWNTLAREMEGIEAPATVREDARHRRRWPKLHPACRSAICNIYRTRLSNGAHPHHVIVAVDSLA
jgi:hypothetical protein